MDQPEIENLIFLPDSPYSNLIIDRSEKVSPGISKYFILVYEPKKTRFITSQNCTISKYGSEQFFDALGELKQYKRIIIHYHNANTAHFLHKNKDLLAHIQVIWVLWSGDLYNLSKFQHKLYQKDTKNLISRESVVSKLTVKAKDIINYFLHRPNSIYHKESFKYINFIASPFDQDVTNAREYLKKEFIQIPFAFLSIEEAFDKDNFCKIPLLGTKIMVGQSGTPENNHTEIFSLLGKLELENEIFCPLAYGDADYSLKILTLGKEVFGDRFAPLTDFVERDDYYKMLRDVRFAIFNHNVQKGFGNILGLIFLGVKVFLNPSNTVYSSLKDWGIVLFKIEDIDQSSFRMPLTREQIEINRKIITDKFSEEMLDTYYLNLLESPEPLDPQK
ncbi:TDP-N-acetylfucosamine:lipid II N-acetylfucosaminyltransferase [Rhodonellum sp.]|uniref:TDP-N-acetylfucosamine:lipid II N-acetylfucosaminyltransferase n=1 Tax=Rhodonellum sp. TaxID=2231180 RepID=UPI002718F9B3|nr:TDP-N-acetylfucosamine:lipid II N-acetylfucosaminyltransferase [Rhodonellum sp.]MDO9551434.1 TDP-N-acetylfucosamine:lipid II N-acetylfucosaminyltransferase [Rhodonellum sp.]